MTWVKIVLSVIIAIADKTLYSSGVYIENKQVVLT